MRDALSFGERVDPPLPEGRELIHRVILLAAVALVTGLFVALAVTPGIALFGSTTHSLANRFAAPIGEQKVPAIALRSVIVDRNGRTLATLSEENRAYVRLARVPLVAQQAVIATEDAKFYAHHGVDLGGLVRALIFNFRSGGVRQGGSTITQQLVKNTLTGNQRTLDRKIEEARRAVRLEQAYTKQQILELYVNETYFGHAIYGIGTAAEFYFGEQVDALTLPQAALLAGIINAPEDNDPIAHPEVARTRRNIALQRMADVGYITQKTATGYKRAALGASKHTIPDRGGSNFVQYIRAQIDADPAFGATPAERDQKLLRGGLRIETTLDAGMQDRGIKAINDVLNDKHDPQAALVAIDPATGAVRALVGSRNDRSSSYNLAVQGHRQPGSTFKTMTLVAALDNGIGPSLTFDTPSPLTLTDRDGKPYLDDKGEPYVVNNFEKKGEGFLDLREATARSVNTYFVQLVQRVGPDKVVTEAQKLGITSDLKPYPSIALGSFAVTPLELASAYATLANNGVHCAPYSIARVRDANGRTLKVNTPQCAQAVPPTVAAAATDILRGVIGHGTAATNGDIGRQAAGKTGTTENHADAWFAGYTPNLTSVVWMGYPKDEKHALTVHGYTKGVTGGTLPTMIWARFMRKALLGVRAEKFPAPSAFLAVTLPDVVGKPLAEARTTLDDAGFPTTKIVYAVSARPDGTVLAQDPARGSAAPGGVLVTLTVARGGAVPHPSPSPSPTPSASPSASPSPSPSPSKSGKK